MVVPIWILSGLLLFGTGHCYIAGTWNSDDPEINLCQFQCAIRYCRDGSLAPVPPGKCCGDVRACPDASSVYPWSTTTKIDYTRQPTRTTQEYMKPTASRVPPHPTDGRFTIWNPTFRPTSRVPPYPTDGRATEGNPTSRPTSHGPPHPTDGMVTIWNPTFRPTSRVPPYPTDGRVTIWNPTSHGPPNPTDGIATIWRPTFRPTSRVPPYPTDGRATEGNPTLRPTSHGPPHPTFGRLTIWMPTFRPDAHGYLGGQRPGPSMPRHNYGIYDGASPSGHYGMAAGHYPTGVRRASTGYPGSGPAMHGNRGPSPGIPGYPPMAGHGPSWR